MEIILKVGEIECVVGKSSSESRAIATGKAVARAIHLSNGLNKTKGTDAEIKAYIKDNRGTYILLNVVEELDTL
jgi:hypothetical protein